MKQTEFTLHMPPHNISSNSGSESGSENGNNVNYINNSNNRNSQNQQQRCYQQKNHYNNKQQHNNNYFNYCESNISSTSPLSSSSSSLSPSSSSSSPDKSDDAIQNNNITDYYTEHIYRQELLYQQLRENTSIPQKINLNNNNQINSQNNYNNNNKIHNQKLKVSLQTPQNQSHKDYNQQQQQHFQQQQNIHPNHSFPSKPLLPSLPTPPISNRNHNQYSDHNHNIATSENMSIIDFKDNRQYHNNNYQHQHQQQHQHQHQHQLQSDSSTSSHDNAAAKPSKTSLSQQQHQQRHQNQSITFSSPNIYKSSLQLTTELEINKWWDNVISIFTSSYYASRIILSIPHDLTDTINTPWGVKAIYNREYRFKNHNISDNNHNHGRKNEGFSDDSFNSYYHAEDLTTTCNYSLSSSSSSSSSTPSSSFEKDDNNHSVFDNLKNFDCDYEPLIDNKSILKILQRGKIVVLSREYRIQHNEKSNNKNKINNNNNNNNDNSSNNYNNNNNIENKKLYENNIHHNLKNGTSELNCKCYNNTNNINLDIHASSSSPLQPLSSSPSSQLSSYTNMANTKINDSNKSTVLDTPCLNDLEEGNGSYFHINQALDKCGIHNNNINNINDNCKTGDFIVNNNNIISEYEEFEQQEPSPWSQSPAPSPIITSELNTNPFFQTIPEIDEDAFDPSSSSSSPSSSPLPTICQSTFLKNNNIYSIVHIPLIHPTTAKNHPSSNKNHSPVPIAILSFLSPIVPFPSILLKSLRSLAPFLATTLSTSMIYQQSTKQLSSYASSLRDYQHRNHNHHHKCHNRHHNRHNNSQHFNLPNLTNSTNIDSKEKDGVDVEEDSCSFSSLSASDSDSSSSKWEYATIFSMTDYDHIDLDGNINNGNNVRDDENVYNDKSDTLMNHDNQSGVDNDNYNQSVINNTNVTNYDYSASPINLGKSPSTENGSSRNDIINENIKNSPSNKFKNSRGASLPTYYSNDYKCNKKRRRRSSSRNFSDFATKNKNINKDCDGKDSPITCCDDVNHNNDNNNKNNNKRCNSSNIKYSSSPSSSNKNNKIPHLIIPNTKMLRMIVDLTPNVVYTLTPGTGDCTWVNMRLLKYTGKRIDNLLGHGWIEVVHQDDRSSVWEMWNRTFLRGEGYSAEYRIRRFDGQYRWFLGRAGPLRDARGVNIRWFGTCTDVHDQKLAEKLQSRQIHIEANEKKYRLLADAIPQIVFTATPKEGINYVNKKWIAYSGQTEEQAKDLGFLSHVFPEDRVHCCLPEVKDALDEIGLSYTTEVRLMNAEGEYRWFLVKCISVEVSEQGRIWFGTCTDINDHKLVEQKLQEAHDAAKRSTESKTQFLSNMSHEIRTPLIGITGMINFMLATNLTTEQMDYAHTIQQSADALLLVINDILDLSKVEAGMMKLEMEPFLVRDMIDDTNELLSTLAIQKGLELSFIVEENVPEVVCGDRIRLRQVLLNIIGNAIKFTSKGEVFSRCSVESFSKTDDGKNEVMLMFEVIDTGEGFDAMAEAVMFKPFSQVDTSSTRKHDGSGLGLVISMQLIELHGGKLYCKSQKGVGSAFYFTAKFTIPPDSTMPRPQTPTSEVSNSPFFRCSKVSVQVSSKHSSDSIITPPSSGNSLPSFNNIVNGCNNRGIGKNIMPSNSSSPLIQIPKNNIAFPINMADNTNCTTTNNNDFTTVAPLTSSNALKLVKPTTIDLPRTKCVLIVADLSNSRKAIVHYVCSILPKTPVPEIDIANDYAEAYEKISNLKFYSHILISLVSQSHVISLASTIKHSNHLSLTATVILTTQIQRAGIVEGAQGEFPEHVDFIFKPLNRSKMEGLFDDTTTFRDSFLKRRNTHKVVASQKEVFQRMAEDVGDRGYKVLLVEDNFVNQKVITKYLTKVGLEVTVAGNGDQCLEQFFSHPHNYFSFILCDLFMPKKDGYETTIEIRKWEAENLKDLGDDAPIPIIALSANVMSDVVSRCLKVGFTDYVSKPVNFAILSDVIRNILKLDNKM